MTAILRFTSAEEVDSAESFAAYSQQTIGTKYPNQKEMVILKKQARRFFDQTPHATWHTLVNTVGFLRSTRRHIIHSYSIFPCVHSAFKAGFVPEMDPRNHQLEDPFVEAEITSILKNETDEYWRNAFMVVSGVEYRRNLVKKWKEHQVAIDS